MKIVKLCNRCGLTKPSSDFYPLRRFGKPPGLQARCISCQTEIRQERYRNNKEAIRNATYLRNYGITLAEYDDMVTQQDGKCFICKSVKRFRKLCVDHDHSSGKVRRLLCNPCNTALGMVQDQVSVLEAMIDYLKEH